MAGRRIACAVLVLAGLASGEPESAPSTKSDDTGDKSETEPRTWGAVDPGKGFKVAKTDRGELSISIYALFRYLNQLPANQTFLDHLGREHVVHARNDLQFHRVQVFFKGWVYSKQMHYLVNVWTVNSSQQVAVVGNMNYRFSRAFVLFAGVNAIPGTRSNGGSHPYWLAPDRVMADEYFRPGYTSGLWAHGEPIDRLHYTVMVGTNLSELGITAFEDTRDLAYGATVWWLPTTGEFGERGGFGDYEDHDELATRFGASAAYSRADRASQISERSPDNTRIRISDSLNLFETDTLAPGVTVAKANYHLVAVDAGLKYRGWFLQVELYRRWLDRFLADGPLPMTSITDSGYYVQGSYMAIPKTVEVYGAHSFVFGAFNNAWEVIGGGNYYPFDTRNMRLNLNVIGIDFSPVSSVFGYYVGGQRGVTVSLASSILF
ncbi:MAG: hypothetical protein HOV81_35055 [Kofleriaceae bacterium]|nr:hypothetical protein [Kofleriaceae bacterium]